MPGFADLTEGQRMYGLMSVAFPAAVAMYLTNSSSVGFSVLAGGAVLGGLIISVCGFLCRTDHRTASGSIEPQGFGRCFMRGYYTAPPIAAGLVAWHLVENGGAF